MLRLVPLLRQLPGRLWSTETRQQAGLASAPGGASFGSEPCSCPLLVGQQPLPLTDRGPGVIPAPQLMANTVEQPKTSTVNDLGRICTLSIGPGHNKVFHDNPGAMTDGKGVQHLPSREEELKEKPSLSNASGSEASKERGAEAWFCYRQKRLPEQSDSHPPVLALALTSPYSSADFWLRMEHGATPPAGFRSSSP